MKRFFLCVMLLGSLNLVYAQTDLMDWGSERVDQESVIGVELDLSFTPEWLHEKVVFSGTIDMPGKTANEIFLQFLTWVAETYPSAHDVLKKVDPYDKRILICPAFMSAEKSGSGTFYRSSIALQSEDNKLMFQEYDIVCNTMGNGLNFTYKAYPFEELFPNLKPAKKRYSDFLDDFINLNNKTISELATYLLNTKDINNITHWNEINEGYPAVGMNYIECILAIGKPDKINSSLRREGKSDQWVYSHNRYVYFDNGILSSMQF